MSKVIAAIDRTAAAGPVLAVAYAVAPILGGPVEAVHVTAAGEAAEAFAAPGLPVRLLEGDVVDELAALTRAVDVGALILGARGRPLGSRPAGHVVLELAERAGAPLVVVPPDAHVTVGIHRVLIAMKGTPTSARQLTSAVALVDDAGLDVTAIHVDDESSIPSFSDQVQHETDAFVAEFLARNVPGVPRVRLELRVGTPADEILRAAESMQIDLIALGWRQHQGRDHCLVALDVLARSRVPVLLATVA